MTKQKRGFFLFLSSLIPGAGEMYMGFRKQGISIMMLFWAIFALAASTYAMNWVLLFLPIIWFYSFFNVHNLKSLSEDEFYAVEDSYILHFGEFLGDTETMLKKYRKLVAVFLILLGFSILWGVFTDILYWLLPDSIAYGISHVIGSLPQLVIAVAFIVAGIYVITDKKKKLDSEEAPQEESEHFWQPYRPYQQEAEESSQTIVQPVSGEAPEAEAPNVTAETEATAPEASAAIPETESKTEEADA